MLGLLLFLEAAYILFYMFSIVFLNPRIRFYSESMIDIDMGVFYLTVKSFALIYMLYAGERVKKWYSSTHSFDFEIENVSVLLKVSFATNFVFLWLLVISAIFFLLVLSQCKAHYLNEKYFSFQSFGGFILEGRTVFFLVFCADLITTFVLSISRISLSVNGL